MNWKSNTTVFADDMMINMENESTKQLQAWKWVQQSCSIQGQHVKMHSISKY